MELSQKDIDRFWSKVAIKGQDDCWLWQAPHAPLPYGRMTIALNKKPVTYQAHRISYFLAYGEITRPCVLHSCDTPLCVNPRHLRQGSHKDNMQDAVERSRLNPQQGSAHTVAKLTEKDVRRMRLLRKQGYTVSKIASMFPVTEGSTARILRGERWKHVS